MPFQALRFIHASNAYVDHQLEQLGALSECHRAIVEEATSTAFEHVVSACIERQAHFLLLAGNTFDKSDQSLRAHADLVNGFIRLDQHGIQVFVVAGETDPLTAWRTLDDLPQNVTLFSPDSDEPVAVLRDGNVIASIAAAVIRDEKVGHIQSITRSGELSRNGAARTIPFSIGLATIASERMGVTVPDDGDEHNESEPSDPGLSGQVRDALAKCSVDYLALRGPEKRQTITLKKRIAHNPGGTQGQNPRQTGPHGCTLVEVATDGSALCTFIPTAPVRWKQSAVHVGAKMSQDELAESMQAAHQRCRPEPTEQLWLINWTIRGSGRLFDLLRDESVRSKIVALYELDSPLPPDLSQMHHFRFVPQVNPADSDLEGNEFAIQYFERLNLAEKATRKSLQQCLEDAGLPEGPWLTRLRSLIDEVDHEAIIAHARQNGMTWFTP